MPVEIHVLGLALILQFVQFILYSISANLQVGPKYAMSARDEQRQLTGLAGRLKRAMDNHFESLIMFAIAVLVVTLGEGSNTVTQTCAHIYLGARILYVPAYAQGLAPWRSVIWMLGFGAIVVMTFAALF